MEGKVKKRDGKKWDSRDVWGGLHNRGTRSMSRLAYYSGEKPKASTGGVLAKDSPQGRGAPGDLKQGEGTTTGCGKCLMLWEGEGFVNGLLNEEEFGQLGGRHSFARLTKGKMAASWEGRKNPSSSSERSILMGSTTSVFRKKKRYSREEIEETKCSRGRGCLPFCWGGLLPRFRMYESGYTTGWGLFTGIAIHPP